MIIPKPFVRVIMGEKDLEEDIDIMFQVSLSTLKDPRKVLWPERSHFIHC